MDYEHKQREAFYLIKKYGSLTWYQEIFRLWTKFCVGYEDMLRHPPEYEPGVPYVPSEWDEQNFRMFWGYAADMEEGLAALRKGDKANGYELLASGCRFGQWLYSRRFAEMDLSPLGYRPYKSHGPNEGIFAFAQRAYDMGIAAGNRRHTDELRRDDIALPDWYLTKQDEPIARHFRIPYGVPSHDLPPLPRIDPSAPSVISGDEVPAMGIWVVEPDKAHLDQTYCMAYMRPWAPALMRVSEQEYELNSRFERTRDEAFRKDSDKIKDYPVRWRLLWRDDRDYSDGKFPPEEADYLVYRGERTETPAPLVRMRCESGQPCPRAGVWFTPSGGGARCTFMVGEVMSTIANQWGETIWQFESDQQAV